MERLSQRDLKALLAFLEQLYAVGDLSSFRTSLLTGLQTLIPCDWNSYDEMNPAIHQDFQMMTCPAPDELNATLPGFKSIWERHMREHPTLMHAWNTGDGSVHKISDFLGQRQFQRTGLYNEFYRRLGGDHVMTTALAAPRPIVVGTGLHRRGHDFSQRERLLLSLLRPHLTQAYLNAAAVTQMQEGLSQALGVLEALPFGTLVLAPAGAIRFATGAAHRLLGTYFGSVRLDKVPDEIIRWLRRMRMDADGQFGCRLPLLIERDRAQLIVRAIIENERVFLLLEERAKAIDRSDLERLGLSPRQAEVLAWVTAGKTSPEIGSILGISPRTVDRQVALIFQKLGVTTRAAAVARALTQVKGNPRSA